MAVTEDSKCFLLGFSVAWAICISALKNSLGLMAIYGEVIYHGTGFKYMCSIKQKITRWEVIGW